MRRKHCLVLLALATPVYGCAAGSDDPSTTPTTTPPGTTPPAVDPCALSAGRYVAQYTKAYGACKAPPDAHTFTIGENYDLFAEAKASGGDCTITEDKASCTFSSKCLIRQAGFTTRTTYVFSTTSLKGMQYSESTNDSTGSVATSCGLEFFWTKAS